MKIIKKENCPFCDGQVNFKEYVDGVRTLECDSCYLSVSGQLTLEKLDSQFKLFLKFSKKST